MFCSKLTEFAAKGYTVNECREKAIEKTCSILIEPKALIQEAINVDMELIGEYKGKPVKVTLSMFKAPEVELKQKKSPCKLHGLFFCCRL